MAVTPSLIISTLASVLNTTALPGWAHGLMVNHAFLGRVPFRQGPARIQIPVKSALNANVAAIAESTDLTSMGGYSVRKLPEVQYKRYAAVAHVDNLIKAVSENGGVANTPDLMTDEVMDALDALKDKINTDLMYQASGTGYGDSDNGVQGICSILDDDNTYALVARGSNAWWAPYVNDYASNRNLTKALMRDILEELQGSRGVNPSAIWSGVEIANKYREMMDDQVRYMTTQVGDIQAQSLAFGNTPILEIPQYPTNRMDFVHESDFSLQWLKQRVEYSDGKIVEGAFRVEQQKPDTDSTMVSIVIYLQLVCRNPWRQGSLQDVE